MVVNDNLTISNAARLFAQSLPPARHPESQEALRFARWFGEERRTAEIRPVDLESYVETFGLSSPNATTRADALKSFLSYAHKQKLMPERFVSHVRVRRQAPRARAAAAAAAQVQMTAEGKNALETNLDALKAQRPRIAEELRDAMADKDFRENAPLDAAREAQGQLEARIREMEYTLRQAVIVENDAAVAAGGSARVGCNVIIANVATGSKLSYQIVNAAEAKPGTGRLSAESPVGQAIIGRKVGEEVQVTAPSGIVRFRIEQIEA